MLVVVSLAMLLVSNGEEIGVETDANNSRDYGKRKGCATSHYDLTWNEQRGTRGGGEKGGCLRVLVKESDLRKIKKTPTSPEGGKNEESSPSPLQHPTFHTIASSIPTHCKTKTEKPSTTTAVMPELPASMMSNLAQILAVQ